jgi:hypothetical protein
MGNCGLSVAALYLLVQPDRYLVATAVFGVVKRLIGK